MSDEELQEQLDHYETLQISPNAEFETINRVFRLLAQRYHPDNVETGDEDRFRAVAAAYKVLSDPEARAKYDAGYSQQRQDRWRLVSSADSSESDFDLEQRLRLTVLEVLYTKRRVEPTDPGIFDLDMESMIGCPREHLQFTFWYLAQKQLLARVDGSRLVITADGVDYLEHNYSSKVRRRLREASEIA